MSLKPDKKFHIDKLLSHNTDERKKLKYAFILTSKETNDIIRFGRGIANKEDICPSFIKHRRHISLKLRVVSCIFVPRYFWH